MKTKLILLLLLITSTFAWGQTFNIELISVDSSQYGKHDDPNAEYKTLYNAAGHKVGQVTRAKYIYGDLTCAFIEDSSKIKTKIIWNNGDTISLSLCQRVYVSADTNTIYNVGYYNTGNDLDLTNDIHYFYLFNKKGELLKDLSIFKKNAQTNNYMTESGYFAMQAKMPNDSANIKRIVVFNPNGDIVFNKVVLNGNEKIKKIILSENANFIAINYTYEVSRGVINIGWKIYNNQSEIIFEQEGNRAIYDINVYNVFFSPSEDYIFMDRTSGLGCYSLNDFTKIWTTGRAFESYEFFEKQNIVVFAYEETNHSTLDVTKRLCFYDVLTGDLLNEIEYFTNNYKKSGSVKLQLFENENVLQININNIIYKFYCNYE